MPFSLRAIPQPLTTEAAPIWVANDLDPTTWAHQVTPEELDDVHRALRQARPQFEGRDLVRDRSMSVKDFPLPQLGERLSLMSEQVHTAPGFALLRGLPTDELDDDDCLLLLRGLAAHLGRIATQSRDGDLIRHVRATGHSIGTATVRGHQTSERLYFHTDGADAAVLLCRRAGAVGGLSRLASAASVHNRLLSRAPALVADLYHPFHFHMAGGNVPDLPPTFISPIFSLHQGRFSCRYVRHTLLQTPEVTGVPLSSRSLEAFDALEEVAEQGCLEMELRPGDLQIVSNHTVLHSRTAYVDDPAAPRHLLRSWLTCAEYEGRRPGLIDEALRSGWLSDDVQRAAEATWAPPQPPEGETRL
jgi:TfdA family taurine catabolism dioxygenase TauD